MDYNNTAPTASVNDIHDLYELSPIELVFWFGIYGLIAVLAVCGNLLVLFILMTRPQMQSVTNYFIANLAVADFLTGLLAIPFKFQAALFQEWFLPAFTCKTATFSETVSLSVSVFTLTCIAADRFRAIVSPKSPKMSRQTALAIIALIWVISISQSLPFGIFHQKKLFVFEIPTGARRNNTTMVDGNVNVSSVAQNASSNNTEEMLLVETYQCAAVYGTTLWWKMYNIYLTVITYFVPLLIVDLCYCVIAYLVWSATPIHRTPASGYFSALRRPLPATPPVSNLSDGRRQLSESCHDNERHPVFERPNLEAIDDEQLPAFERHIIVPNEGGRRNLAANDEDRRNFAANNNDRLPATERLSIAANAARRKSAIVTQTAVAVELFPSLQSAVEVIAPHASPRVVAFENSKKKVVKMLCIVVMVFTFCWLPYETYLVLNEVRPGINDWRYINILFFTCHWLAMSNSCLNPIIYGIYNGVQEKFQREYQRILCGWWLRLGGRPTSDEEELTNRPHVRPDVAQQETDLNANVKRKTGGARLVSMHSYIAAELGKD